MMNNMEFGTRHWPHEIRVKKAEKVVEIDFDDGKRFALPAELLRVESPSAEIQGHSPDEKKVIGGCRDIGIADVQPVGNYAIAITFSDMHDSGIFSWDYLYELGDNKDALWRQYLDNVEKLGLSRDEKGERAAPVRRASGGSCGGGGGGGGGGGCGCGGGGGRH